MMRRVASAALVLLAAMVRPAAAIDVVLERGERECFGLQAARSHHAHTDPSLVLTYLLTGANDGGELPDDEEEQQPGRGHRTGAVRVSVHAPGPEDTEIFASYNPAGVYETTAHHAPNGVYHACFHNSGRSAVRCSLSWRLIQPAVDEEEMEGLDYHYDDYFSYDSASGGKAPTKEKPPKVDPIKVAHLEDVRQRLLRVKREALSARDWNQIQRYKYMRAIGTVNDTRKRLVYFTVAENVVLVAMFGLEVWWIRRLFNQKTLAKSMQNNLRRAD